MEWFLSIATGLAFIGFVLWLYWPIDADSLGLDEEDDVSSEDEDTDIPSIVLDIGNPVYINGVLFKLETIESRAGFESGTTLILKNTPQSWLNG